ncbi:hypothetical protein F8M41_003436 [Gigaspora margarita]|uniref:Uncharacterized protein n=1 Tax=Gigaspora margarita TaxID=4874 RepID=A0A8H4ERZ1_GIGMA|nr:hypothetical protein F8M41_003436 [Gigaspora margarita]
MKFLAKSSDKESSKPRTLSKKQVRTITNKSVSNESTCIPFEQINPNNTMLANNIAWPYQQNQNLNNNYTSTRHISYPRLSSNIDPVLYNLDNTRLLNENTDVLHASPLFHNPNIEYQSVATKNFNTSEDQYQSLS